MTERGPISGGYYTDAEEIDIFTSWGNALCENDPALAEMIVKEIVELQFPEKPTLDRTE
jgi:hypothetical protein